MCCGCHQVRDPYSRPSSIFSLFHFDIFFSFSPFFSLLIFWRHSSSFKNLVVCMAIIYLLLACQMPWLPSERGGRWCGWHMHWQGMKQALTSSQVSGWARCCAAHILVCHGVSAVCSACLVREGLRCIADVCYVCGPQVTSTAPLHF
jgi:hypothetical protein